MTVPSTRARYPWPRLLGLALLWWQVAMIVHARFDPLRYFCWAPFDSRNHYRITRVEINGQALDEAAIAARYRVPPAGLEWRAISHLEALIEQFEQSYGRADRAHVEVVFQTNGGPEQKWNFENPRDGARPRGPIP